VKYRQAISGLCLFLSTTPILAEQGKPAAMEQMTVTARQSRAAWNSSESPLGAPLLPESSAAPVTTVAELVQTQPGISYAGQGGLLQTVSIRGISGQQVANFWGDLPVLSDRRAGTSSSFIDPLMLGPIEILRGPASTYYGNGAVAGVLQLTPAHPTSTQWQLQWGSAGDENLQYFAQGGERLSLALSRRAADDIDSAEGDPLHTEFEQYNAQLLGNFEIGERHFEFQQLVSEGRDIGKSNSRFPDDRITDYPEERHWLGQISGDVTPLLHGSLFYHYQELDTRVERLGDRLNEVDSESLDWGLRLGTGWMGSSFPLRMGVDYFGRRNVEASETETDFDTGVQRSIDNLDAEQDNFDLYIDGYRDFEQLEIAAGLRAGLIYQDASGQDDVDDSALSAFARASYAMTPQLDLSLEIASGVRFAGLSERYFSGTTGRGSVLGNRKLEPEDTLGLDLGLRWHSEVADFEAHAYGMKIDDYIERVDLGPDLRSFVNLTEGEILGLEAAAQIKLNNAWSISLGGHYVEGEDDNGTTLANIAPATIFSGLDYRRGPWQARLQFDYRFSESDVAPGELPVDSANQLSASLVHRWPGGLQLSLWGRNLLDESWRLSTDDLATEGPERSVGITLAWSRPTR
jgi:iron complex outermembrane receptor protein